MGTDRGEEEQGRTKERKLQRQETTAFHSRCRLLLTNSIIFAALPNVCEGLRDSFPRQANKRRPERDGHRKRKFREQEMKSSFDIQYLGKRQHHYSGRKSSTNVPQSNRTEKYSHM